ncbi:hypothetical protein [Rummeliibacillus sp. TYF-LIM-RU47]|uniref:hypothetical protein n=1 Tax=Rummeliibacillus sp. TYF-LIM-RU47 TaxID=2608406 RepID=UPI001239FEA4|nr:hypothetical protein [Rummeliibacillus sp. TYF-LIM-RU47]
MNNIYEVSGRKGFNGYSAVFVKASDKKSALIKALSEFERYYPGISERYENGSNDFYIVEMFKDSDTYFVEG